ncbi:MAG: peptidase M48 [Acidobacteria bacterium]|nr:MAG: peptidase M48 [Acidobacteriota bacterium]
MASLLGRQNVIKGLAVLATVAFVGLPLQAADSKSDVSEIGNRKVAHKSIISQEREIAAGRQYAAEIDRSTKFITDPVINEYVNRVAQNVARNSDLKVPLTVKVIDGPEINAFALPGGFLYVYSGLLKAASEEDQFAGVMAHEIAHVAARHWASQMTKARILDIATIPLIFVPMTYPVYIGVSQALNIGVPVAFLKFSRDDEAEADYLGLQYMYKAGYDPNAYVAFFGKVLEEERRQPGSVPKIFQDHPPTPDRILKAEEEIKQLPKRDEYLVSTSEFDDVKGRLNTVVAALRKKDREGAPTLEKRPPDGSTQPTTKGQDQGDEKPPVLKRRD